MPRDSVTYFAVDSACNLAEISYCKARVKQDAPYFMIPIALDRLGNSGEYLGTSLIAFQGIRTYVAMDSAFSAVQQFGLGS
ncbi:MAG: hypothetical protein ABJB66_14830 [Gemmatimonadaceae bacterium]